MKEKIHPGYGKVVLKCSTCGKEFVTGSILKEKDLKIDTCSNCHPFYTGKQRFTQADGRVDKFNKKYGIK